MKKEIIKILSEISKSDININNFYYKFKINKEDVNIYLRSQPDLKWDFPLRNDFITQLIKNTKPSQFGRRSETLLDTTIRNSKEIQSIVLDIGINNCLKNDNIKDNLIKEISNGLGIPDTYKINFELHNMIIYEKGNFFTLHRDTEKLSGMIATMVLAIPSYHKGGTLKIYHHDEEIEFNTENSNDIEGIIFYSDCFHEVLPVLEGNRVVVTFNVTFDKYPIEIDIEKYNELCNLLKEYSKENNFCYYLEHQYTENTFGNAYDLSFLKGRDRHIAEILKKICSEINKPFFISIGDVCWKMDEHGSDLLDFQPSVLNNFSENRFAPYFIPQYTASTGLKFIPDKIDALEIGGAFYNEYTQPFNEKYSDDVGNWGDIAEKWYKKCIFYIPKGE